MLEIFTFSSVSILLSTSGKLKGLGWDGENVFQMEDDIILSRVTMEIMQELGTPNGHGNLHISSVSTEYSSFNK